MSLSITETQNSQCILTTGSNVSLVNVPILLRNILVILMANTVDLRLMVLFQVCPFSVAFHSGQGWKQQNFRKEHGLYKHGCSLHDATHGLLKNYWELLCDASRHWHLGSAGLLKRWSVGGAEAAKWSSYLVTSNLWWHPPVTSGSRCITLLYHTCLVFTVHMGTYRWHHRSSNRINRSMN